MRINTIPGNKRDAVFVNVKNSEASATIPVGSPVCLVMNGTDDGLGVVLPSGSAAKAHAFLFGVISQSLAPGAFADSQVYGFVNYAVILRQTRSASSADWSSNNAGFGTGVLLNVDTRMNAFSTSGGTLAVTGYLPFAVLAASVATWASTAASDTGVNGSTDTRTAITVAGQIFVRMM